MYLTFCVYTCASVRECACVQRPPKGVTRPKVTALRHGSGKEVVLAVRAQDGVPTPGRERFVVVGLERRQRRR